MTEGLDYINGYMHPQAIITDDSTVEEAFFIRGIRKKANEIGKSIIELPSNAAQTLMWITRLDTGSLKGDLGAIVRLCALLTCCSLAQNLCGYPHSRPTRLIRISYQAFEIH